MKFILTFFLTLTLISCQEKQNNNPTNKTLIPNKYAKGFEVYELENGDYWIKILNPQTLQQIDELHVSKKGLKKVIPFSATHIGFIDLLNETQAIKGVTYPEGIFNEKIKKGLALNTIQNIGSDMEPNKELILSINPELVLTFPNNASYDWMENFNLDNLMITEFLEASPMAQAEWIRLFGCLFNKQHQADSIFNVIDSSYQAIKQQNSSKNLTVLAGELYDGNWTLPGGNSFTAKLIEDAGGNYVNFNDTSFGSYKIDYELILNQQDSINYWVMLTFDYQEITKNYLLNKNQKYQFLELLDTNKMIVCNSAKKPYFEEGITQPHLILKELINAFDGYSDENRYFKQIKNK